MRRAALAVAGVAALAALAALAGLAGLAALSAAGVAAHAAPARASGISLTVPIRNVDPLKSAAALGVRPDRLLTSVVPGPVRDNEAVTAAIGPTGAPAVVTDRQQLVITKPGNYIVRELGPARKAEAVGDTVPPVLELGQVVWQGFSPATRTLQAVLTLDPGIEAHRLPMAVTLRFRDRSGHQRPLQPGGVAAADGSVEVTLVNQTGSPRLVEVGTAEPAALARSLDRLYAAARAPRAAVPPHAGAGLAATVPGTVAGQEQVTVVAPLRVTGTLTVAGSAGQPVHGPGTTAIAGGAQVSGTLDGSATFDVDLARGQRLAMDLDVRPWLDPRQLVPPATTWSRWASAHPSGADVTSATTTLAENAAAAARAAEYSPYLQADTPGPDLSSFRYVVASRAATPRAGEVIRAKPSAIAAACVALVAVAGNAALWWRQL